MHLEIDGEDVVFWPRFETQQFEHSIRKWEPIPDDRARINKSMLPLEFLASDWNVKDM